jgi:hypothetical protein
MVSQQASGLIRVHETPSSPMRLGLGHTPSASAEQIALQWAGLTGALPLNSNCTPCLMRPDLSEVRERGPVVMDVVILPGSVSPSRLL